MIIAVVVGCDDFVSKAWDLIGIANDGDSDSVEKADLQRDLSPTLSLQGQYKKRVNVLQ